MPRHSLGSLHQQLNQSADNKTVNRSRHKSRVRFAHQYFPPTPVTFDVPNRFGVLYLDVWRMKNRCNVEPYVLGSPGASRQTKNCDARPQASRQTTEAWGQTRMLGRLASRRTGSSVAVKPLAVETWFVLSCVSVGGFDSLPTRLVPFAFGTKR